MIVWPWVVVLRAGWKRSDRICPKMNHYRIQMFRVEIAVKELTSQQNLVCKQRLVKLIYSLDEKWIKTRDLAETGT